jgi:DNA-binding NtrC family response regulator
MRAAALSDTRLLIVEDDMALHALIARLARRQGFEVQSAYTGEHALSVLRQSQGTVDWRLADIRLPGLISGWVVGSEFSLTHPLRPVIYMSGVEEDDWRRPVGSLFLEKPVDVYDLLSSFQQMSIQAALAGGLGPGRALPISS